MGSQRCSLQELRPCSCTGTGRSDLHRCTKRLPLPLPSFMVAWLEPALGHIAHCAATPVDRAEELLSVPRWLTT